MELLAGRVGYRLGLRTHWRRTRRRRFSPPVFPRGRRPLQSECQAVHSARGHPRCRKQFGCFHPNSERHLAVAWLYSAGAAGGKGERVAPLGSLPVLKLENTDRFAHHRRDHTWRRQSCRAGDACRRDGRDTSRRPRRALNWWPVALHRLPKSRCPWLSDRDMRQVRAFQGLAFSP